MALFFSQSIFGNQPCIDRIVFTSSSFCTNLAWSFSSVISSMLMLGLNPRVAFAWKPKFLQMLNYYVFLPYSCPLEVGTWTQKILSLNPLTQYLPRHLKVFRHFMWRRGRYLLFNNLFPSDREILSPGSSWPGNCHGLSPEEKWARHVKWLNLRRPLSVNKIIFFKRNEWR